MFNSHPNISNISILTIYALNVKSWAQISPHENFRYWASLLDTKYQWYIFIIIIFNCLNINNAIANLDKNTLLILDFDHKLSHLLVFSQSRTFINSSGLSAARGWRHSFSIHCRRRRIVKYDNFNRKEIERWSIGDKLVRITWIWGGEATFEQAISTFQPGPTRLMNFF